MLKITSFIFLSPSPILKCVYIKIFPNKTNRSTQNQSIFSQNPNVFSQIEHFSPKPKGIFTKTKFNYFLCEVKQ